MLNALKVHSQDIRGAGITGSGDRDWAPNPAFDFGVKSYDSKPQDGYHKFDLKRMARVGAEQGPKNQGFEQEQLDSKAQGQAVQRRLLEQQISENASRKEVSHNAQLVISLCAHAIFRLCVRALQCRMRSMTTELHGKPNMQEMEVLPMIAVHRAAQLSGTQPYFHSIAV